MTESDIEPGQTWEIDCMRPEDAERVVRLFRYIYGNDYPIRTFIDPEALIAENVAERTISSVARTPKGDIVGHNAIFHSAPSDQIFETGAGLVHRHYRGGKGIFKDLVIHGRKIAECQLHAAAIWGEPICNQIVAQRANHSLGLKPFAIEVDLMPAAVYAKEGSAPGRVSTLMTFTELHPRSHRIFAPRVYEERLGILNRELSAPREMDVSVAQPSKDVSSFMESQVFTFAQAARLTIQQIGFDLDSVFENLEKSVLAQGAQVLQVWLRLADPAVGWAADRLRAKGYFFGGLLPHWFSDDGMLMQRVVQRPHWENIQLAFDWSRKVVELAHSDWAALYD